MSNRAIVSYDIFTRFNLEKRGKRMRSKLKHLFTATILAVMCQPAQAQTTFSSTYYMDGRYAISWAHLAINRAAAKTAGMTGRGISIAVFDTGLDVSNPKFTGNLLQGWNIYGNNGAGEYRVTKDNGYHGTFVSGIIAANMTLMPNMTTYGIAPEAKIMPIQIFDENGQGRWTDSQFYTALNYAMIGVTKTAIAGTNRGGIFNNSWNSNLTLADIGNNADWIRSTYKMHLYGWGLAAQRNILNVWAAGNYGKSDPGYFATMPSIDPKLLNSWIVVVATDRSGNLASWSNACGIAAAYCMAAPGENILSVFTNSSGVRTLATGSGTSFAAPIVSGSAALLWQYFPYLKASEIQQILFTTANKSGVYANSALYGQGMLDLTRAFQPVGTLRVATSSTVTGTSTALTDSYLLTTSNLSGSVIKALAGTNLMVLDQFNRHYHLDLGAAVAVRDPNRNWGDQLGLFGADEVKAGGRTILRGSSNGYASSFVQVTGGSASIAYSNNLSPSLAFGPFANGSVNGSDLVLLNSVGNPYMNMAPNGTGTAMGYDWGSGHSTKIGAFSNTFPRDELNLNQVELPRMHGSAIEHTMRWAKGYISASVGMVAETQTVLGSRSNGQLSLGKGANTAFMGMNAGVDLVRGWSAFGGFNVGYTMVDASRDGLIKGIRDLTSGNAYAGLVKAGVFGESDRFGITMGIPLSIGYGSINMRLPTDRDLEGNVAFNDTKLKLRPSRTEFSMQGFYNTDIGQNQSIGFGLGGRFSAADLGDNKTEVIGMARYKLRF